MVKMGDSRSIQGILNVIKKRLDKTGTGRQLLSLLGFFYIFGKTGKFVRVFFDLAWGHKYSSSILFDRQINWALSPDKFITETQESWLVLYQPKPGDVVIDIGAGIGAETFYFSQAVGPTGKVVSIEAHPETFNCLGKMCEYNKLENVIPLNLAIADTESRVRISDPDNHIGASIIDAQIGFEVEATSLDILSEKLGISEIAFIKMNIEGAERLAVAGMSKCIRMAKYVSISCHDFIADAHGNEDMRTKKIIIEFLEKNGFAVVTDDQEPRGWIRDSVHGARSF